MITTPETLECFALCVEGFFFGTYLFYVLEIVPLLLVVNYSLV